MPIGRGIILPLLLIALIGSPPLSAQQRAETGGNQSPAVIAGGNSIINYGLSPEQMQELTKAAAAGAVGPLVKEIVELSNRLGVTEGATRTILGILGQGDVPLEQLPQKLAEVAEQYQKAQTQLAALNPQNPLARGLVEQAQAEIKVGNFDRAHQLLGQAKQAQIAAAQQARQLLQQAQLAVEEQLNGAAASSAADGDVALTELHYRQAADLFKEAANLVPPGSAHEDKRIGYLNREADALYQQGDEYADNDALSSAIKRRKELVKLTPRERVPLDWAATQNKLGIALATLGEREDDTARLEEAVVAYREALKERTRARAPVEWAETEASLSAALWALGSRESGTVRLEEAVVASRDALKEQIRDRGPLSWARTHNNLGNALFELGVRNGDAARLEEAGVAYSDALKEWPRATLAWVGTQTNLGNVLATLGERESGTRRLEEAVVAYRAALQELPHARAPLAWATAQMNLGNALTTLGRRNNNDAGRLEEAVVAYYAALQELAPARAALAWAAAQANLGVALATLGARNRDDARLKEAVAAYRNALKVRTRAPTDWAMTQHNLGDALSMLGALDTAWLEEAVAAYSDALKEFTRERVPLQWAVSFGSQGIALMHLAERTKDAAMAETALRQIEAALETARASGHAPLAADFEARLSDARRIRDALKPP